MKNYKNFNIFAVFYIFLMIFCVFLLIFQKNYDFFYNYFCRFTGTEFCYITKNCDVINSVYDTKILNGGGYNFVQFKEKNYYLNSDYKQAKLIYSEKILNKILSELNVVTRRIEIVEDIKIIYSYTPFLNDYIVDNCQKVNLQFAIKDNSLTIGYPTIYSGY